MLIKQTPTHFRSHYRTLHHQENKYNVDKLLNSINMTILKQFMSILLYFNYWMNTIFFTTLLNICRKIIKFSALIILQKTTRFNWIPSTQIRQPKCMNNTTNIFWQFHCIKDVIINLLALGDICLKAAWAIYVNKKGIKKFQKVISLKREM